MSGGSCCKFVKARTGDAYRGKGVVLASSNTSSPKAQSVVDVKSMMPIQDLSQGLVLGLPRLQAMSKISVQPMMINDFGAEMFMCLLHRNKLLLALHLYTKMSFSVFHPSVLSQHSFSLFSFKSQQDSSFLIVN